MFLALSLNPIQALRPEQNLSLAWALDLALSLALSWMVQEALAAVGSQRVPKPCFPSALEEAMGLGWGCSSLLFFSLEFLIPFLMLSIPSTGGCRRHRQGGGALIDKGGVDRIDRVVDGIDRVGARIDRVRR